MRISIASRIFDPEPSAASFRLSALASSTARHGYETTVLTVRPPAALAAQVRGTAEAPSGAAYRVRRFPVLRDAAGYVRGYLPYLSFDIPLFFRILCGKSQDLIIVEPPPTTGFFVRLAARLRRSPYVYYAADIWSDAAAQTGAPGWMVSIVRAVEKFALRGARVVLSVSPGVTSRLSELGVRADVVTIGNGVDAARFTRSLTSFETLSTRVKERPEFVYAGTASEWHGADVFIRALPSVLAAYPAARIRFIGGGAERSTLDALAVQLGVRDAVTFEPVMHAEAIAPILQTATAAIASVRPGAGYDFAFPTKLYSAAVCGAPLLYAGRGPAVDFVRTEVDGHPLGEAVDWGPDAVAAAMIRAADAPFVSAHRATVARWAHDHVALDAVADRAIAALRPVVEA